MMKRIGMTQRVEIISSIGERRNALSQEWSAFAKECGFLPIFLPNDKKLAVQMMEELKLDGILLTGGNDLIPYGGDAPERDETEESLIVYALKNEIPLLGVCRGMQMILNYFGVPLQKIEGHVRTEHELDTGDLVNSYHSFGAISCQEPLVVKAICKEDKVIEMVKHREQEMYGIMWHPERYHPFRKRDVMFMKKIFQI